VTLIFNTPLRNGLADIIRIAEPLNILSTGTSWILSFFVLSFNNFCQSSSSSIAFYRLIIFFRRGALTTSTVASVEFDPLEICLQISCSDEVGFSGTISMAD